MPKYEHFKPKGDSIPPIDKSKGILEAIL